MTHPTLFQRALACHIGNISPDVRRSRKVSAVASFLAGLVALGIIWGIWG